MATIEERLALYRKNRTEKFDKLKEDKATQRNEKSNSQAAQSTEDTSDNSMDIENRTGNILTLILDLLNKPIDNFLSYLAKTKLGYITSAISEWKLLFALKFCLWLILFGLFVELEFGFVFVVCSMFFVIFTNLGKRKRGEKSAYSVFNENCERLDGTFTAEQFERELRHGSSSVR